ETHFTKADDDAFAGGGNSNNMLLDFGSERAFDVGANFLRFGVCQIGAEDALHWLYDATGIAGALDIFDDLNFGQRNGLAIAARNLGIGGLEYTQLLKGDLNGHGELSDFALVHLSGRIQDHKKGKEQGDEVRVGDQPAFVVDVLFRPALARHAPLFSP